MNLEYASASHQTTMVNDVVWTLSGFLSNAGTTANQDQVITNTTSPPGPLVITHRTTGFHRTMLVYPLSRQRCRKQTTLHIRFNILILIFLSANELARISLTV